MALPASSSSLFSVLQTIQSNAQSIKGQAQDAVASLNSNVNTNFIFTLLDRLRAVIDTLNGWKGTANLDSFATANLPNYAGAMTADISAAVSAAQACIDWVVANFPRDSTATYLLAESLNSDGTRTQRTFTSAQTSGLRTLLQTFITTIS